MPLVDGHRYYPSTALFLSEIVKLSFFVSMSLYEIATSPHISDSSTVSELAASLSKAVFTGDSWKLAPLGMLYTLQNSLTYVVASNLDALTSSVASQLKIVSTAIFGAIILGQAFNLRKWLSLVVLTLGVLLVQLSSLAQGGRPLSIHDLKTGVSFHSPRSIWDLQALGNAAAGQLNKRSATYEGIDDDVRAASPENNASYGLAVALITCVISGLAGVYFEKILKGKSEPKVSVWLRNLQLSCYSLAPTFFIGVIFLDGEHLTKTGFFAGYNWMVLVVVVLQAIGGVLVALAISLTDSMTKNLATSVSVLVTLVLSLLVCEFQMSIMGSCGLVATLAAAYAFCYLTDESRPRPPPINVSMYEKSDETGYFDIESVGTASKSPLRDPLREALSSSRPGTPTYERRPIRAKREQ